MKNKIVSTIKTSAGELELSEDALCKHTIFIGSTGSGKTTSLNVLLRDIIGYNAEDETQKVGLLVFDLKGDNTLFKIRKWAKECGREDDVIDYCADSKFYFDPLGGLDSFRKIPEYVERLYNIFPFQSSEVYWEKSNPFNSVFFRSIKKASGYLPRSPKIYMMFTFFCGMPQTPTPAYRRLPRMWRVREPANLRQTKAYCPRNPCLQVTIPARYCLSL